MTFVCGVIFQLPCCLCMCQGCGEAARSVVRCVWVGCGPIMLVCEISNEPTNDRCATFGTVIELVHPVNLVVRRRAHHSAFEKVHCRG